MSVVTDPELIAKLNSLYSEQEKNKPSAGLDILKGSLIGGAQGLGDVGASIANFPAEIIGKITGNQPYKVPHPNLEQYYPESRAGRIGAKVGELIAPFAVPGFGQERAAMMASGLLGKSLARMGAGGVIGAAETEGNRDVGAAVGAGIGAVPSIYSAGKKAVGAFRAPFNELQNVEKQADVLAGAMKNRGKNIQVAKQDLSRHLQEKGQGLAEQEEALKKTLGDVFPIIPKSETRANLANEHKKAINDLNKEFKSRYGEFNQTHGATPIREPIRFEDFLSKTKDLSGLSDTLQEMRINPSKKIIKYNDSMGGTQSIKIPSDKATVDDYIGFMREIRDASFDALNASKNATHAEKMDLLKTHRALKDLQGDVESKIEDSIGKNNFTPFRKIQEDYKNTVGAIKSEPSIRNASYDNKVSDSLFNDLLQPKNEQLRKHLYSRSGYKEALREHMLQGTKHPISEGAQLNPAKIDADTYKLLSNSQKIARTDASILSQGKSALEDVAKILKNPETMTALQEQTARGFSKEADSFLNRITHEKNITKQMEEEAKRLNISKEELTKQVQQRKLMASLLGAGAALKSVPIVGGYLYNKLTSSN